MAGIDIFKGNDKQLTEGAINTTARPGAVDPRAQQIDVFPLDAFEFDDPKKNVIPVVRLKTPWIFDGASIKADTIDVDQLLSQQITVGTGGRIRYETGSGVQKRCVQLADEKIDWLDTPDTPPASPEQLRARIGRLGVGGSILMDGEFLANCGSVWTTKFLILNEVVHFPNMIQETDGSLRCVFRVYPAAKLYEITKAVGGSWSVKSLVLNEDAYYPTLIQETDGSLRCVFTAPVDMKLYEITKSVGGSWSTKSLIFNDVAEYPDIIQETNGSLRCIFTGYPDGKLYEITKAVGGSWSTKSLVLNESAYFAILIQETSESLRCVFRLSADLKLYEITKAVGGSWSTKSLVLNESATYPNMIQETNGGLRCVFRLTSDGKLYEITKAVGGSWSAKSLIFNESATYPNMIQETNGSLRCVFTPIADSKLYEITLQRYAQIGAGIIESTSTLKKFGDGTNAQTASGASTIAMRDASSNIYANAFYSASKREWKHKISNTSLDAVKLLKSVKVVEYRYKNDPSDDVHYGFIADDTDEVLSGPNKDSMRISDCIGVLIKAVQELAERV